MVNVGEPRRQSVVDGEADNYLSTGAKARSATGVQEAFLKSPSRVAFSRSECVSREKRSTYEAFEGLPDGKVDLILHLHQHAARSLVTSLGSSARASLRLALPFSLLVCAVPQERALSARSPLVLPPHHT